MIEITLRIVIIFTCIMVAGCGIVFFFLIKRAKAAYCEKEEQTWEVVERKYLRKRNRVILLYTCILILFYLLIYENNQYKLNLDGTMMSEYEIILPEGIITEDLEQLVNENVARPIYKYEVVEELSETCIRLYQNIGTAQNIIGKVVTTITYNSKDSLTDYYVKKVEFKKN